MLLRPEDDPLGVEKENNLQTGAINIIDLANTWSCSFIATEDVGKRVEGGIEILGRLDNSEIRGCSLLVL